MIMDPHHNWMLVSLSYCVSVFGSFTGLQLVSAVRQQTTKAARIKWIISAALALGGGAIWTMHFIGMLAYDMGMPVGYDPLITFVSLIIAVAVVGVGISIVSEKSDSLSRLLLAGLVTGLGVASMHYAGMEAMVVAADMSYDTGLLLLSIVIGIAAATAALWLAFNLSGTLHQFFAAFVMGVAVCGMHYTGMAAMTMTHNNQVIAITESIDAMTMGLFIFFFSMLLLVMSLIAALGQLNRQMYDAWENESSSPSNSQPQANR